MNLALFRNDVNACLHSTALSHSRAKGLALLLVDRWNEYSPLRWTGDVQLAVHFAGRPLNLALRMDSQDYSAFREIFLLGMYEAPMAGPPATILDLGANCGMATLAFASLFPQARFACVEPHPGNLAALRANLDANQVTAAVIDAAIVVTDGAAMLKIRRSLLHGLVETTNSHLDCDAIPVRGISIPTLLRQLHWDRIDLLKIDIEGYERILFSGCPSWLNHVSRIIGECHHPYGISQLRSDLEPAGFTVNALDYPNTFFAFRGEAPAAR